MENEKEVFNFTARKDHEIHQNDIHLVFKKGEKYAKVDRKWRDTLKAEKVI